MKDGKYLTAEQKTKIAGQFLRFIEGGFNEKYFTKDLYKHLSLHFGFIAHYNQAGFYAARFGDPSGLAVTFEQILKASPWTYNDDNTSGNADLNLEILALAKRFKNYANGRAIHQRIADLLLTVQECEIELRHLKQAAIENANDSEDDSGALG